MKINNIIFDLGGVLIDWNPDYVFLMSFREIKKKCKNFTIKFALLIGMKIKMQDTFKKSYRGSDKTFPRI